MLDHYINVLPTAPFDAHAILSIGEMRESLERADIRPVAELVPDLNMRVARGIGLFLRARLGYSQ